MKVSPEYARQAIKSAGLEENVERYPVSFICNRTRSHQFSTIQLRMSPLSCRYAIPLAVGSPASSSVILPNMVFYLSAHLGSHSVYPRVLKLIASKWLVCGLNHDCYPSAPVFTSSAHLGSHSNRSLASSSSVAAHMHLQTQSRLLSIRPPPPNPCILSRRRSANVFSDTPFYFYQAYT